MRQSPQRATIYFNEAGQRLATYNYQGRNVAPTWWSGGRRVVEYMNLKEDSDCRDLGKLENHFEVDAC